VTALNEGTEEGRAASPALPVSWETASIAVLEACARDAGLSRQLRALFAVTALARRGLPLDPHLAASEYGVSSKTTSKAFTVFRAGNADKVFAGQGFEAVYMQSRTARGARVSTAKKDKPKGRTGKHGHGRAHDKAVVAASAAMRVLPDMSGIRDTEAETKYLAMHNAPKGATNVPLIGRADKVAELLDDLTEIDPADAASMMPAVRCRQFSGLVDEAVWWAAFVTACDHRRRTETPGLGHMRRKSRARWLAEGQPDDERDLGTVHRAILDYLRDHGPATVPSIGVAIGTPGLSPRVAELVGLGLIEPVGQDEGVTVYAAVTTQ
jgi:hypothetical protein